MQALPVQLAASLTGRISLGHPVERLTGEEGAHVLSVAGRTVRARRVVVAAGASEAAALTGSWTVPTKGAVTQWFAVDDLPTEIELLHVDGRSHPGGPVLNTAVVSSAAPSYAPAGAHLVQASALLPPDGPASCSAPRPRAGARWRGTRSGTPCRCSCRRSRTGAAPWSTAGSCCAVTTATPGRSRVRWRAAPAPRGRCWARVPTR
jgi:phytoene dehydrogenase-like protein